MAIKIKRKMNTLKEVKLLKQNSLAMISKTLLAMHVPTIKIKTKSFEKLLFKIGSFFLIVCSNNIQFI